MSVDTELRAGLSDWRRHAVAAMITLTPMLFAAAVAWGVLNTKVEMSGASVKDQQVSISTLQTRLAAVEREQAISSARLEDIRTSQDKIESKLDRLLDR